MKNKLLLVLVFVLLFTFGCEKKEKKEELNILNWSSYIPSEIILNFEKETGIRVNYSTYSSNEELLAKIWNNAENISNRTIDTNITRLRKKLGEYGSCITTRLGYGYGFQELHI